MAKNAIICLLAAALAASLLVPFRRAPEGRQDAGAPGVAAPPAVTPPGRFDALRERVDGLIRAPGLAGAAIGICVLDPAGEVVFDHHAEVAGIPASSFKTLTTAAALEVFGPDHRILTRVCSPEALRDDGVLPGDLCLVGGGDPTLSLADLDALAADLAGRGLKRVEGRVIGDGRLFGGSIYADFWNWGDIGNGYGSPVSGLNLEHNRFRARFRPGAEEGAPAALVAVEPEVPEVEFVDAVRTGPPGSGDGVTVYGGEQTGRLFLRGTVPAGRGEFDVVGAAPDPERFAAHHFHAALARAGVEVAGGHGGHGLLEEGPGGVEHARHLSPPLGQIVHRIHRVSDNHETECLYQLLGIKAGLPPAEALRRHWAGRGLELSAWRSVDGSGLARADFITPRDLAAVQHLAATGPAAAVYKASLPSRDGGALRWKGGAMSAVRSYAGFAVAERGGEEFRFALIVNHYSDSTAVAALREAFWEELRRL